MKYRLKLLNLYVYLFIKIYSERIKEYLRPSMFISFGLAWFLTNGWCYLFIMFGTPSMKIIGSTWAAILWFPFTAEKIVTITIALWIQKNIFIKGSERFENILRKKESKVWKRVRLQRYRN